MPVSSPCAVKSNVYLPWSFLEDLLDCMEVSFVLFDSTVAHSLSRDVGFLNLNRWVEVFKYIAKARVLSSLERLLAFYNPVNK